MSVLHNSQKGLGEDGGQSLYHCGAKSDLFAPLLSTNFPVSQPTSPYPSQPGVDVSLFSICWSALYQQGDDLDQTVVR